jgi:hypothetical protein
VDRQNGTAGTPTGSTSMDGTVSRPPADPPSALSRGSADSPGPTPPSPAREGHPAGAPGDAVAVQVERVETLLAAVRDIVSSLGATSAQLEREVAQALRPASAAPAAAAPTQASASRAKTEHGSSSQDALEAERAALLEAVEHRAVIEQAKGMLMLKHRCDADDAFGLLLEISRRERRKVREIAADLVRAGSRPRPLVDLTGHHDRPALR